MESFTNYKYKVRNTLVFILYPFLMQTCDIFEYLYEQISCALELF